MSRMVDFRCPLCNQLLQGKEQVALLDEEPPKKILCTNPDCGCEAHLEHEDDVYTGRIYFYNVG